MKNVRFWGVAGVLGTATVLALVWLAPAVHGQHRRANVIVSTGDDQAPVVERDIEREVQPQLRMLEALGGRGSHIGVGIRDLADEDIKSGKAGVRIEDVAEKSPAAQAGIKAGDVVTSFDGERVRSARQFARLVDETPAGRSVKTQVMRDGKPVDLTVTPAGPERTADNLRRFEFRNEGPNAFKWTVPEIPDIPHEVFEPGENFDVRIFARPGRLGVNVQGLTPDLAEYFGVKDGVLVTGVTKESPAAKAGVKAGDVITSVNGNEVDDAGELRRQLRTDDDKDTDVTLGIVRDKKPMTMNVPIEAPKMKEKSPVRRRSI